MLAIGSLPYPIAAILSHKARNAPRKPTIQSSIEASSSPYKLTKRKNYLRPKILRTLRKPHLIPLSPPTPEDPITPIEPNEPNLMVPSEPTSEKSHSSFVEEFETPFDSNDSGPSQLQVVQRTEAPPYVVGFKGFSSRTIFRIVASFVGLFVLQTVVSVWMMGSSYSDEKDRNMGVGGRHRALRLGARKTEVGLNGNAFPNVDESEMEKKIVEIRQLAREVRNIDKKKSLENTEADDVSDDDDDDDGLESDSSKLKSGIVKEVDGRLTKLRKRSPTPLLNVNFLNNVGELGKEGEVEGLNGKEEDNMLMFEMKHKFRSHLTTPRDKPKGFQSPEHGTSVREKHRNMDDDDQTVGRNGNANGNGTNSSNDNREINGLASGFPERSNVDSQKDDKKPISRNSSPLQASKESSGSNSATKKLNKGFGGSTPSQASKKTPGSNSATKKLNKGKNEGTKPKRGVVQDSNSGNPLDEGVNSKDSSIIATQDSRKKINDRNISTASKTLAKSRRKVQPDTEKLGRKSSMIDKELNGDPDPWWLTLPYVFVILMQKGPDSEGQQGFFKIRISSDAGSQSYTSYMVGFEDRGDARNFSYLLESEFEDLPDATIDVVPFPVKELKEVVKSVNNKVIVVKKGELQLYAGQPLSEVESALISLVK